jgi:hypothetical protein
MALAVCFKDGKPAIVLSDDFMTKSLSVPVRVKVENPEKEDATEEEDTTEKVYRLFMSKDILYQMLNSTTGSDKKTLKEAAKENGYGTASLNIIITALSATVFTFCMTGDELVKMSELIPKDDVYYVYEWLCEDNSWPGEDISWPGEDNDGDESDGDSDGDHSNGDSDGDHSNGDSDWGDLDTPMQPACSYDYTLSCGNCGGELVNVTDRRYLLSRQCCASCGQGA